MTLYNYLQIYWLCTNSCREHGNMTKVTRPSSPRTILKAIRAGVGRGWEWDYPDPTRKEGSGEQPCSEVSSWNATANFLFQLFNTIGQVLLCFSMFYHIRFLSLFKLKRLVGWSDVLSLVNTDSSIPALKTLPGKIFPQTLPRWLGLGPRLHKLVVNYGSPPPMEHTNSATVWESCWYFRHGSGNSS